MPNPIYLPNLRNQASIASVLMRALLNGPSDWLAPAVTSAIPEGTALSVDAVTINDGIAEVALSDNVLNLNDGQRTLMAAQVLYTLQPTGIQGVTFTVNQQPYAIPGADQGTYEVTLDSRFAAFDPIPPGIVDSLYTARDNKVSVMASLTRPQSDGPGPRSAGRGSLAGRRSSPCRPPAPTSRRSPTAARCCAGPRSPDGNGAYGARRRDRPAPARVHPVRRAVGGR